MIETPRLILRRWRAEDAVPFHAMGRDPQVMRYLGPMMTAADARADYRRMVEIQARVGHCFWAVERRSDRRFIGFCGLLPADPVIGGEIEIGWRFARAAWGQGFALEAATASLGWAWSVLGTSSVAAVTVPANRRSRNLMTRLGMTRDPWGDFDHPHVARGDPLRRHVTYRISRPA